MPPGIGSAGDGAGEGGEHACALIKHTTLCAPCDAGVPSVRVLCACLVCGYLISTLKSCTYRACQHPQVLHLHRYVISIRKSCTLWQVRRREAEEHARRMNLLFPSAAAAAQDLPPPPPKVSQRDKDAQESLLASRMVDTSECTRVATGRCVACAPTRMTTHALGRAHGHASSRGVRQACWSHAVRLTVNTTTFDTATGGRGRRGGSVGDERGVMRQTAIYRAVRRLAQFASVEGWRRLWALGPSIMSFAPLPANLLPPAMRWEPCNHAPASSSIKLKVQCAHHARTNSLPKRALGSSRRSALVSSGRALTCHALVSS